MVLSVCASMIRFAGNRACSKLVVLVLVLVLVLVNFGRIVD